MALYLYMPHGREIYKIRTQFLRDLCVICLQIARHIQPRTTDPNRVKLVQKSEFIRERYVILTLGLCDRAFKHVHVACLLVEILVLNLQILDVEKAGAICR